MRGYIAVMLAGLAAARWVFKRGSDSPQYHWLCFALGCAFGAAGICFLLTSGLFPFAAVCAAGGGAYLLIHAARYLSRREMLSEADDIKLVLILIFAVFLALVFLDR